MKLMPVKEPPKKPPTLPQPIKEPRITPNPTKIPEKPTETHKRPIDPFQPPAPAPGVEPFKNTFKKWLLKNK